MIQLRPKSQFLLVLVCLTYFVVPALCPRPGWSQESETAGKKIAFMAGNPSHGYGSHEHYAGCLLLAKSLQMAIPDLEVVVHPNGWPEDDAVFADADVLVMYCDGGGGHPVLNHLEFVDQLADKGVGIVCIHYGVEVPKGEPGQHFLKWIGGYFETHWSVNPHWTAKFQQFPDHPITRGVEPFEINDEWYYHMRFREGMEGVTPILTAVPPESTLSRPDGAHSGNPHVRKTVGQPQHVAWAAERPNGGRGFGFTGGHFHWNWGDENFRRIVLNAILWTGHIEVPEKGVRDRPVTLSDLEENQDYKPKPGFNRDEIRKRLNLKSESDETGAASSRSRRAVKPVFASPPVTVQTPGHAVAVEADIREAKQLFLVVDDAGNGFSCDWADWAEPRLVGPKGELPLTELKWKEAATDWGQVRINKNAGGGELRIDGKPVEYGIGTHANSLIAFDLPPGYEKFVARGGLDNGGTDQGNCGSQSSVRFSVYTSRPAKVSSSSSSSQPGSRDPQDAVAGLDVAEGLEATLFASEPDLLSLTNLDIDHRGRVWVCEVVNYRKHNGRRPEGDRILILEDTDGDGIADTSKVYYQGRDIDSAMGICVLGNRVIVSASPNILVFTDEDGDDRPDRKEVLFSKTGQPQHDHSAHSFLFGPDGKLYWNFGNTGKAVHDAEGNVVVDLAGNKVVDNGNPYYGGMPFRCNLDGSQFEVLAHNFRNNYEVTVDSFGSLWQSDNDDDGNRGVRINYVMEYGNYGYRDEKTGAGWREPRTGMHEEIPLRHWHLNDPGVVPNLLQTGAGSPTGITVYEGRLLPETFWDEVIHCDAGPNIVRAYPVEKEGAGYEANVVNILHGARDNWFRPADVCVAPDGSIFVTDWYDPGVGGHNMQDLERGRLFRVAPPEAKYQVPPFDFSTIEGSIEALKNPSGSVRYLAWQSLHDRGTAAEEALLAMYRNDANPRFRARALWLLGKIEGRASHYARLAAQDDNPDLRITALRLARQEGVDLLALVSQLVRDPSPQVRRECAIALRGHESPEAAQLWAELAMQHDGQDRWYLEALGIGAEGQWDRYLAAWLEQVGEDWNRPAPRDILWRSRAQVTPEYLARIIAQSPRDQLLRFFRAFDFLEGPEKDVALVSLAFGGQGESGAAQQLIAAESIERLKGFDVSKNPEQAQALQRLLDRVRGTEQFVALVDKFQMQARYPQLVTLAQDQPSSPAGIAAARLLLDREQRELLTDALQTEDKQAAVQLIEALGNSANGRIVGILMPWVRNSQADAELRRQATRAIAKTTNGAQALIQLAKQNELEESLKVAAAFQLNASPSEQIRKEAQGLFPLPPTKNNTQLPPITKLVEMRGNTQRGAELFANAAQCAKCHQVNDKGKEVGPALSGIGSKLSRQALFESIIYPSAGISHNYESYAVALASGNVVTGILVSETDDTVTLRTNEAITLKFDRDEIEEMKKQSVSLMPADLQKTMTPQDLVDVVEYLATLRKPSP